MVRLALLAVVLGSALGLPARGQAPATPVRGLGAAGPVSGLESGRMITDVFVGRNAAGPYLLSWKGIDHGSEVVSRNGRRLSANLDYTLDAATGVLKFATPLRASEIARVDYRITPGRASASAGGPGGPMQFSLLDRPGVLSLNAIYRPDAPAQPGSAAPGSGGSMLLALGGSSRPAPGSALSTQLYMDARGGSLAERGGVKLSESTSTGFGKFTLGFQRGGRLFQAGQETGIASGRQVIEAGGALLPIHGFTASATFRQTEELPESGQGAVVTVLGQRIAGTLGAATRIQASRTETTTEAQGGETTRVASRLQIDQRLDARTQATAVVDHAVTDAGGARATVQSNTLSVQSQPASGLSVQGSFQNRLLASGPEDHTALRIEAAPARTVRVTAGLGERYSRNGALHSREAALEYNPLSALTLSGLVQLRSDGESESVVRGIRASARPLQALEISGGVKLRDASRGGAADPSVPDTYDARLALGILNNTIRLTGGVAENPEDEKGIMVRVRSRSVGLQSAWGPVELGGSFARLTDLASPRETSQLDLRVGWRFGPASQLAAAYRGALTREASLLEADTYSLSLRHRVGAAFEMVLSGSMTQYSRDGLLQPSRDYSAEAKLGIRF